MAQTGVRAGARARGEQREGLPAVWGGRRERGVAGARRGLLAGAALALGLAFAAGVAPETALAFTCDSVTNPPGGNSGANDNGSVNNTACGTNATASGDTSSAYGRSTQATGANAAAFGTGFRPDDSGNNIAGARNENATAAGFAAQASGESSSAYGFLSTASDDFSSAYGARSTASGLASSAYGNSSDAIGDFSSAYGNSSDAIGEFSSAYGAGSEAIGDGSSAFGAFTRATQDNAAAFGTGFLDDGSGVNIAGARNENATAAGFQARASGPSSSAYGHLSSAEADNSSAFGAGATVLSGHTNSTALGAGATTTRANQMMMGTGATTYTMAGIASGASKAAQGSPTHIVTSNASGDLAAYTASELGLASAADLGAINNRLERIGRKNDEQDSGIALAMATQNPDLTGNETFGVAANWGSYEGANALGVALAGVLAKNFLTANDRVALSGGVGVGFDNGGGDTVVGGRVGLQWTR